MVADLLVRNGLLVDGTGAPARPGDVLVSGGRVAAILPPGGTAVDAREVLEARDRVVAPGFIDMHSHSDVQVIANPDHESRLLQGVTTEVIGQDGLSYAPVDDEVLEHLRAQLKGWNDDPDGFDWCWRSVGDYLRHLEGKIAVNVAYLVPHGTLRLLVVGSGRQEATPVQLRHMARLLQQSLDEGAVGMSAGLTYVPGAFATTEELVSLCHVVAAAGGYFCPHHRNYGLTALESYKECVEIARMSKVPLHLAHTHLSYEVNRGRVGSLVSLLDKATDDGVDLSFDSYPYLAAMTSLHALLPSWVQAGEPEAVLARLKDPGVRSRVRQELDMRGTDGNQGLPVDWGTVVLAGFPGPPWLSACVGKSLAEGAAALGAEPSEHYLDLVTESGLGASCVLHVGIEEHVQTLLRHRVHTVGSDGILVGERPHPRGWGSFPRFLGRYVRDLDLLSLPEAVRHCSGTPARRIGAPGRGVLAEGAYADIVVFDAWRIQDQATYEDPRRTPVGVDHVVVNGKVAVRDGAVTHSRSGRVLRRPTPPRGPQAPTR
ncbi:MAG: N-acyl-D-amino-acid deacylase family protein [Acidimicrobiales bacterium]